MPRSVYIRAYASLRVFSPTLDPLLVTQSLLLPPDHQHRPGEPRLIRTAKGALKTLSPWCDGQWLMSSEKWVQSARLETHVRWLLDQVEPRAEGLRRIMDGGATCDFFCYSLGKTTNPPALTRAIQERAAALGIEIQIDHYSC